MAYLPNCTAAPSQCFRPHVRSYTVNADELPSSASPSSSSLSSSSSSRRAAVPARAAELGEEDAVRLDGERARRWVAQRPLTLRALVGPRVDVLGADDHLVVGVREAPASSCSSRHQLWRRTRRASPAAKVSMRSQHAIASGSLARSGPGAAGDARDVEPEIDPRREIVASCTHVVRHRPNSISAFAFVFESSSG